MRYSSPIRGNEVHFCLLNIPHQACREKLEDKEILCYQLNIPVSQGNLEDKSVCMGNEGNKLLNVPVDTKETDREATMCLQYMTIC
jgi:hypothetical protein